MIPKTDQYCNVVSQFYIYILKLVDNEKVKTIINRQYSFEFKHKILKTVVRREICGDRLTE